ncbi:MAG: hypothetical protein R3A79_04775 [Nannocystaceae bacterium]
MAKRSNHWNILAACGLLALVAGACDSLEPSSGAQSAKGAVEAKGADEAKDEGERAGKPAAAAGAATTKVAAEAAAPAPAVDTAKVQKALGDYRSCALDCLSDPKTSETDRESCKLTCRENAEIAGIEADTPVSKIADRFDLCLEDCTDPKLSKNDRETCKLNCQNTAESLGATLDFANPGPSDPADTATLQQGCARSCMQQMAKCERLCDEEKVSETDKETCRLLCSSNGEICLDTCNIEAAKAAAHK